MNSVSRQIAITNAKSPSRPVGKDQLWRPSGDVRTVRIRGVACESHKRSWGQSWQGVIPPQRRQTSNGEAITIRIDCAPRTRCRVALVQDKDRVIAAAKQSAEEALARRVFLIATTIMVQCSAASAKSTVSSKHQR